MDGQNTHAVFNKGPVVVFRWRNEAGWPVEYVSDNVREVLGYDAEAFRTQALSYGDIVMPDDAPRVASEVAEASTRGLVSFEHEPYRVRHGDGSARWLHDFTHVIRDAHGQATHFVGYIFDITRRIEAEAEARELERRLLHAQKLESLGLLAGGIAHDFNNVLTGMLGQLGLARRLVPEASAPVLAYLDQLEQLAEHAAGLTNQLLAYSGKGSFVVEPIDLNALLAEMAGMIKVVVSRPEAIVHLLAPSCRHRRRSHAASASGN
ncbi:MAG: PAS domain-containing protein [Myxococcales bacterium]|nr:PAS domain-containing protein [Myxococcales bacterium]